MRLLAVAACGRKDKIVRSAEDDIEELCARRDYGDVLPLLETVNIQPCTALWLTCSFHSGDL